MTGPSTGSVGKGPKETKGKGNGVIVVVGLGGVSCAQDIGHLKWGFAMKTKHLLPLCA